MTQYRASKWGAIVLLLAVPRPAQGEAVWEEIDGDGARVVVRMTVTPADEPQPAFKYRLTLLPHELVPGNSVAHYMRAFPEGGIEKTWRFVRDEFGDEVDDWYTTGTPVSQLPRDQFVAAAAAFDDLVQNYIGPGSRCRNTDWGVSFVDIKGPEIISFLLPEIQAMRSIARAVSFRTRLAIIEHRYNDAIDLIRVNYRLGRDVGKQPILVSGLVGIAICGITNANTTDLIAAPDSPNLYWALTELPRPLVSLRDALRLEMALGQRMFEILDDPEHTHRSAEEWNALWKREATFLEDSGLMVASDPGFQKPVGARFLPLALGLAGYAHAKDRLIAWGYAKDDVDAMAVGQVLAIYSAQIYETIADEWEKVAYVDLQAGRRLLRQAEASIQRRRWNGDDPDREIIPIASLLLPAVTASQNAAFRIERDLDVLRVIEALRMHAAQNDDQWPKSLSEITCVPVPNNLATGEPFEYWLDGEIAILNLPLSDGFHIARRYELKIAEPTDQKADAGTSRFQKPPTPKSRAAFGIVR